MATFTLHGRNNSRDRWRHDRVIPSSVRHADEPTVLTRSVPGELLDRANRAFFGVICSTLDSGLIRCPDDSRHSSRDPVRANHLARRASGPPSTRGSLSASAGLPAGTTRCPPRCRSSRPPTAHIYSPCSAGYPGRSHYRLRPRLCEFRANHTFSILRIEVLAPPPSHSCRGTEF
jgi:hypothetical protein